jgi:hypothetical protein
MENPETHATYAIANTFAVTLSASKFINNSVSDATNGP